MKRLGLLLIMIAHVFCCYSNNEHRTDSLLKRLETEQVDSNKADIFRRLYRLTVNSEPEKAKYFLEQGLTLSRKAGLLKREAIFLNGLGEYYRRKGDFKQAVSFYMQSLALCQTHKFRLEESWAFNNLGEVARMKGDYTTALKQYQQSLRIKEELNDQKAVSSTLNNIGLIFLEQKKYKEALLYFERSLETRAKLGLRDQLATNYTNIGRIYYESGNYLLALQYFQKSLELDREFNMPDEVMMDLNNISEMYVHLGKRDSALIIIREALKIAIELGDTYTETLIRVNVGDQLMERGDDKEAIVHYERAISLGEHSGFRELLKDAYRALSELYYKWGDHEKAFTLHQQYTILKDSIYNAENLRIGNEMQVKYETEKKNKALTAKKADAEVAVAENKKRSLERNMMLGGVGLGIALAIFVFRSFRQQQRNNKMLQEQKEIIEEKQREILDSIRYARRIQQSLMPTEKNISRHISRTKS
ncbi:MAG: tetratricopeptide repeat protein [Bacteroidia bacterium]|nr:tetratricopeptide repeat protein [Bacteroidia bacterium]